MKPPRFALKKIFFVVSLLAIPLAICARIQTNRIRDERIYARVREELESTREKLQSGELHIDQAVTEYLALATPREVKHVGPYSEFQHGFPGGLGHGITIYSKNEKLVRAYSWSCVDGEEFFNSMTNEDEIEFGKLRSKGLYIPSLRADQN